LHSPNGYDMGKTRALLHWPSDWHHTQLLVLRRHGFPLVYSEHTVGHSPGARGLLPSLMHICLFVWHTLDTRFFFQ